MIPAGTTITFQVQGSTGEWIPRTPDDVRSQAMNFMAEYFTVNSIAVTKGSTSIFRELWDYGYSATVRATTLVDHAGITELKKVVADAFAYAAGEPATVQADGYDISAIPSGIGGTTQPPSSIGLMIGLFALAAIAVAIATWKNT